LPTLNFERRGSGEPLVLLHSLGAELVVWSPVIDLLAPHRDVVAIDMPGFGGSATLPGGEKPTPRNLAKSVVSFCEQLGLERPHVAGTSLGGWVAIECARLGATSSVTTLCSAGFWDEPLRPRRNATRMLARAALPVVSLMRLSSVRRIALSRATHRPERVPAGDAIRLVRSYATSPGFAAASEQMRSGMVGSLTDVPLPLTLAWGEFDRLLPRSRLDQVPTGVTQTTLRGCGHIPTWDDPEQVARVLRDGSGGR
jgi:pimeloyl-ACP methyl ester carboxylesterase